MLHAMKCLFVRVCFSISYLYTSNYIYIEVEALSTRRLMSNPKFAVLSPETFLKEVLSTQRVGSDGSTAHQMGSSLSI